MKLRFFMIFVWVICLFPSCAARQTGLPNTVQHLDTVRFTGMWYEIARSPFPPQKDCAAFASRFERISDEAFGIVNYCWYKTANGPMRKTRAEAYFDGEASVVVLKIQLKWPTWQDMFVLHVDEGYNSALLGTADRRYLWILSRTTSIGDVSLKAVMKIAQKEGYDTSRLIFDSAPIQEFPE